MIPFDKKMLTFADSEKSFEYVLRGPERQEGLEEAIGPTLVLINGAGGPIEGWMKIWPMIPDSQKVFAYNRPGVDKSAVPSEPQTGKAMAEDLKRILSALEIEPPYLLVGHSLGGFIAYLFATMQPKDICGVVFLESSTIEDVMKSKKKTVKEAALFYEVNHVLETVSQIKKAPSFPQVPVAVIAGYQPLSRLFIPRKIIQTRLENQKKLLNLSNQNHYVLAFKSGHFPQMSEPQLVVDTIMAML